MDITPSCRFRTLGYTGHHHCSRLPCRAWCWSYMRDFFAPISPPIPQMSASALWLWPGVTVAVSVADHFPGVDDAPLRRFRARAPSAPRWAPAGSSFSRPWASSGRRAGRTAQRPQRRAESLLIGFGSVPLSFIVGTGDQDRRLCGHADPRRASTTARAGEAGSVLNLLKKYRKFSIQNRFSPWKNCCSTIPCTIITNIRPKKNSRR